ncbi:MAG: hypothetical protein JNM23_08655 [Bradyrhizobiaceae bacterium]|nr:hypothetical protein [Bradyrhizobiaceae bacterium]
MTEAQPKPAVPVMAELKPTTQVLNDKYMPAAPAAEPLPAPNADPAAPAAAAPPKPLKPGPVAVFISKKEGKLFVRKGFDPVFEVPVKIANPEVPLGTHVYTASENRADSLAFNWMVVSLPGEGRVAPASEKRGKREKQAATPPVQSVGTATATEALDRVEIPAEAADRLAEMLGPGASLIISDKGLGYQTGKGTDFIVLSR